VVSPEPEGSGGLIYRSNLYAPDLHGHFKHVLCRPMPHSNGHSVLSDFADSSDPQLTFYQNCGFATHDEAAILWNVAFAFRGEWLDIGGHTGWTAAHLAHPGNNVIAIDPMYRVEAFKARAIENLEAVGLGVSLYAGTSREFFEQNQRSFDGVMIDGDHMAPHPEEDARNACAWLNERGAIIFHDAIGEPVQQGVRYLIGQGFRHRIYWTPHVVAVCWRGDFQPPDHIPDLKVKAAVKAHCKL
jgi:protein-L-isoaspartate O-methyltransferase